jgi:signal transduction histidine kinase
MMSPEMRHDEVNDLRVVLAAGGISAIVLAVVVLLSDRTGVLDIPTRPTFFLAALTGGMALAGLIALQVGQATRRIAWAALVGYALIATAAIHFTGGPQTPMPGFYLLIVVAASFVLGQSGASFIGWVCALGYGALLVLEYTGALPIISIWRIPFDARNKGLLLVVNWLTVATPILLTAFMSGGLAERLKQRNQQLRALEGFRREMTELLVHDLRNPLTVLLGTLDLINMILGQALSDEQRNLLNSARRSGHLMLMMIGDMLDVAKLEAGQLTMKPKPLQIPTLLADAAEQFRTLADLGQLTVAVAPSGDLPPVTGDLQLIERVLANLISNAIKHTPPGGSVILTANLTRPRCVTVSVRDTGEGIPLDQQQKIFQKFAQVDKDGVERQGTGLGLTFCRMAVEAHKGEIWVESEEGQGSVFAFTLPL